MAVELGVAIECEMGRTPFEELLALAQLAERLGFARLALAPPASDSRMWDPIVALASIGGASGELGLGLLGLALAGRQTVLVAKQLADLAVLSERALRVGVVCPRDDVGVVTARIEMMRMLWSLPLVTHRLGDEVLDRVAVIPRPVNHPQVWIELAPHRSVDVRRIAAGVDGVTVRSAGTDEGLERTAWLLDEIGGVAPLELVLPVMAPDRCVAAIERCSTQVDRLATITVSVEPAGAQDTLEAISRRLPAHGALQP